MGVAQAIGEVARRLQLTPGVRATGVMTSQSNLSDARRKVVHDVNTFGWHVMQVTGRPGKPGWSYSIGLFKNYKHPEVVIFGLDLKVMHSILNIVGRSVQAGSKFSDGDETRELLERFACTIRPVNDVWYAQLFGFARWFYGEAAFPMLQVFWPDPAGRFPWQSGFDASLLPFQPRLYDAAGAQKPVSPEA
jgi:hypothetical protein